LFHLDWERTLEAVVGVIVLAFIVERVGALVFESRFFIRSTKVPEKDSPQAILEAENVKIAHEIIKAEGDAAKLGKAMDKISADSPLWPPNRDDPAQMQARAKDYLEQLRTLNIRRHRLKSWPIKEVLAFLLAALITLFFQFDAVAIILLHPQVSWQGALLTAAVIAGGSKASIKLFHDLLGVRSSAYRATKKPKDDTP
jgi:hypothetical protein